MRCKKIMFMNDDIYCESSELTELEIEIMKYVALGLENKEIGKICFISPHTVKAHLSVIFRKLAAKNRSHAVYLAHKNNYID